MSLPEYWTDDEVRHWQNLDHSHCTLMNIASRLPAYEMCMSTHCHFCGQSTSSQGHLKKVGDEWVCPTPLDRRKPWPANSSWLGKE